MTTGTPMTPPEQNELLGEITTLLVDHLPEGWRRLVMDYLVVGRHVNVAAGVRMADGSTRRWSPPKESARLFSSLRSGMYVEGRGTWYSLELIVDPPATYSVRYNWDDEPGFRSAPDPEHFRLDQERFPRDEENMPAWFRDRLATAPPAAN
ncbi:hypothetical protein [Qaidamihabitans albus]|uniref:hypothetical protein n=1 Tax=Qaidamihabitans albus TaxID=2795733 RepID=UPI0018F1FD31|nr:hypothetical protein [Qaidamihabitans albus]